MQFPVYQVPYLGNGMVIGVNAIIHVLLSHGIAVGTFAMIVLADWTDTLSFGVPASEWEQLKKRLLRLTVATTGVIGALTGVGIWFTTSALAPRAIASLLRVFFWPWFLEWIVFTLEVVAILTYYFLWDRLGTTRRKLRLFLGAVYVVIGLMAAFLVTGILGFMLTPGSWPGQRGFWPAFFNPTFLPQLVYRVALCFFLGSIIAVCVAVFSSGSPAVKARSGRLFGIVTVGSLPVILAALWWYFAVVPKVYSSNAVFSVLTSRLTQSSWLFAAGNAAIVLIVLAFIAAAIWGRVRPMRYTVIPALVAAALFAAEFERIREFIRGPYIMPGYMYANGVLVQEQPWLAQNSMLGHSPWYGKVADTPVSDADAGAFLFSQNCSACHTIGGVNDIRRRAAGRTEDGLFVILAHTHEMIPWMPPFSGTRDERRLLARFIYQVSNGELSMDSLARHTISPKDRMR